MGFIDIFRISKIKAENEQLKAEKQALTEKLASLGADDLLHARTKLSESNQEIADNNITLSRLRSEIADLSEKNAKSERQLATNTRKLSRTKELYKSMENALDNFSGF